MHFHAYMVRCSDEALYVGSTNDLTARIHQHNTGKGGAFTSRRIPVQLVWSEPHATRVAAEARERQLKKWSRDKKEALAAGQAGILRAFSRSREGLTPLDDSYR